MTRMTRAPGGSAASSFASGTPAAMEISRCSFVKCSRISASTPATWSGFTARMKHPGKFGDLGVGFGDATADFVGEIFARSLHGIAGHDLSALTIPAWMKPLASAVAILPAPRKPMLNFADMPLCISPASSAKAKTTNTDSPPAAQKTMTQSGYLARAGFAFAARYRSQRAVTAAEIFARPEGLNRLPVDMDLGRMLRPPLRRDQRNCGNVARAAFLWPETELLEDAAADAPSN